MNKEARVKEWKKGGEKMSRSGRTLLQICTNYEETVQGIEQRDCIAQGERRRQEEVMGKCKWYNQGEIVWADISPTGCFFFFYMHGSVLCSSLTGPQWRSVYCGTIQKSFIITVLPQSCLALCHHDNHCVSLCFQAPRTRLSQIVLPQLAQRAECRGAEAKWWSYDAAADRVIKHRNFVTLTASDLDRGM